MKKYRTSYKPSDKLCDIVCSDDAMLQVLNRFEIPLGFGEKTVQQVCDERQVDCATFLCIINLIHSEVAYSVNDMAVSIPSVMEYLRHSHHYFLDFCLPRIRENLVKAMQITNKMTELILRAFDEYALEMRHHMNDEDQKVFTYVSGLLQGQREGNYNVLAFAEDHHPIDDSHVEARLSELKNMIIKYYAAEENDLLLNSVLEDIFSCDRELSNHCLVEDSVLIPAILKLEKQLPKR